MRRTLLAFTLALLPTILGGCDDGCDVPEYFSQVVVGVVVTDQDGFAWENMEVHLTEVWSEWNACVCRPAQPVVLFTDKTGYAVFDAKLLSAAGVGFQEVPAGVAVLGSEWNEDQATVRLTIGHATVGWVRVDVPLTYASSQAEVWVKI
jgi:hypothetical protein